MKDITLAGTPVKLLLSEIGDNCLRVTVVPVVASDPLYYLNGSHITEVVKKTGVSAALNAVENVQDLDLQHFRVRVDADPLTVSIYDKTTKAIQRLSFDGQNGDVAFHVGDKDIFGLGQGFPTPMDRRGEVYDMKRHGQERPAVLEYATISAVPYIVSREGWGLFFHEPLRGTIDLSGETGKFSVFPAEYRDIFVVNHRKPEEAATAFYKLTGKAPLPPKYALGYVQSFRELCHNGKSIVMPTARYMRENEIPCDLLIYLGRYVKNGWNSYGHNGMFEFNRRAFPDPRRIIEELHELDYKVAFHITETPSGLHGDINDDDVNPLAYDHVKNYWDRHARFNEYAGNDGWWPDDGDGLDLAAVSARHKMYHDGTEQITPNKRGFFLQRNSYCGDVRHGTFIWSGDVLCKWETLKNHIHIGINVSMSLSPYWGSDIGGFYVTDEYSGELYVRWFEYATFTPLFRSHGRHSFLHTPWGWETQSLSEIPDERVPGLAPNMCDAVLPDHRVEPICKRYIELRYRLMPYIYTLAREANDAGVPMIRPLWFRYPDDEKAATCNSQYMFGNALLVNPVTTKGAVVWTTYLPGGHWYDFFTKELIEGGLAITKPVTLENTPVYVPAGSLVPVGKVKQFIGDDPISPLDDFVTIFVYEGADGSCDLYEDDGITKDYQKGKATFTTFVWHDTTEGLSVYGRSSQIAGQSRTFGVVYVRSGTETMITCVYDKTE